MKNATAKRVLGIAPYNSADYLKTEEDCVAYLQAWIK
jgi:hypothetical protein